MGVRGKLILSFFVVTSFSVLVGAAGLIATRLLDDVISDIVGKRVPVILEVQTVARESQAIVAGTPLMIAAGDSAEKDRIKADIDQRLMRLNAIVETLNDGGNQASEMDSLRETVAGLSRILNPD